MLSEVICNSEVSDLHLGDISRSYCYRWRDLRALLHMERIVARSIDRMCIHEDEKRAAFFDKWKEVKGSGATYKVLISALLGIDCRADAEGVCRLLQTSSCSKSSHIRGRQHDGVPYSF
jgi:transcriptional regulator of NAD metabolism